MTDVHGIIANVGLNINGDGSYFLTYNTATVRGNQSGTWTINGNELRTYRSDGVFQRSIDPGA